MINLHEEEEYERFEVPTWYINAIADQLIERWADRSLYDITSSTICIINHYKREIKAMFHTCVEHTVAANFLEQFLVLKPYVVPVSENYICTVPNNAKGWEKIVDLKRSGMKIRLRGRGKNRKARMEAAGLNLNHTCDISYRIGDTIAIYKR